MHLSRYINYWSRHRANETVLVCGSRRLTWRELDEQSSQLAQAFVSMGLRSGDRLGCLLGNCLEWCVTFVAAMRAGAIFVPLNPAFGYLELTEIAKDAGCIVVVSSPRLIGRLDNQYFDSTGLGDEIYLYSQASTEVLIEFKNALGMGHRSTLPVPSDNDVMAICYTSGTTGIPKGVMLTHTGVEAVSTSVAHVLGLSSEERLLILASLAFTGGIITNLVPTLYLGARAYIECKYNAKRALELIVNERITLMAGVPALYQPIRELPEFESADISSLRNGLTGGAPVPVSLLSAFAKKGTVIRQSYGCTEAGGCCTLPTRGGALERPNACGNSVISCDIEVRSETGAVCAETEVGEVYAKGPQVMRGYWNKPELTAAAFDGDWYRTGDLGYLDKSGDLVIVDRKKNMLISGGVNIYPAEVERALAGLLGAIEIAVIGVPSQVWGEEVVAIAYAQGNFDREAALVESRRRLGGIKAPKQIRVSRQPLPKTDSLKVARAELRKLFEALPP